MSELWSAEGGSGDGPVLVLLHGLGHTANVWDAFTGGLTGPWVAVDLPGHGRSPWRERYSFGGFAAEVADAVAGRLDGREAIVVGHSMGGVVALALAGGTFGLPVRSAVGFGIKVSWTDQDLDAMRSRGGKPPKVFGTEDEARTAFLRFGGLDATVDAAGGVQAVDGGYRLATDPRTMLVGVPPMAGLLAGATVPVLLAAGEHDHMVTPEQLRDVDPEAVVVEGVGHNLHVTDPDRLLELVRRA